MRKLRFFTERKNIRINSSVLLQDFEADHIRSTLRLRKGDVIYLFNGEKEFCAKLKLVTKEAVMAVITEEILVEDEQINIHLFQGLSKSKSFELILEKCTELGVSSITPLETEYSVIKYEEGRVEKKIDRWQKIIRSAAKQSERVSIPEIENIMSFEEALQEANLSKFDYVIFTNPNEEKTLAKWCYEHLASKLKIAIFVGPEGGFSPFEITKAKEIGSIQFVSLTRNILRSETAAVLAVGVIMAH